MNEDTKYEIEYYVVNETKDEKKDKEKFFIKTLLEYIDDESDLSYINENKMIKYEIYNDISFDFYIQFYSIKSIKNVENGIFIIKIICLDCDKAITNINDDEDKNDEIFLKTEYFLKLRERVEKFIEDIVSFKPLILKDDYTAKKTQKYYPMIYQLENDVRNILTKIISIYEGKNWIKNSIPSEVKNRSNSNSYDLLYNINFKQINNFLFAEYPSKMKKEVMQKVSNAIDVNEFTLEEIKILIDTTNWEKYFKYFFKEMTNTKFKTKWEELYAIRNKIAHNGLLEEEDIKKLEKYINEFNLQISFILKIINNTQKVKFIDLYHKIEDMSKKIAIHNNFKRKSFNTVYHELVKRELVDKDEELLNLKKIYENLDNTEQDIEQIIDKMNKLYTNLKEVLIKQEIKV